MATGIQLTPESLCDGLDQLCIQRLELMDKLIRSNMMLEGCMRGGFFLLGKTRYTLGSNAVSALQLPNEEREVDALATAVTTPLPVDGYEGDILYQQVETKFQDPVITLEEEEQEETGSDELLTCADDLSGGQLRRRFRDTGYGTEETEVGEGTEQCEVEPMNCCYSDVRKTKTINRDPIRWFSALPPQTLRQAQSEFKTALQVSAQCATLQLKLRAVNKEYRRLMKIKEKVERMEKEP